MTLLVDRPDIKLWTEKENGKEVIKLSVVAYYDRGIKETWILFTTKFETECELVVRPIDRKNHTFLKRELADIRKSVEWMGKSFESFVKGKIDEIAHSFISDVGIDPQDFVEADIWLGISPSDVWVKLFVPYELIVGVEQESKWVVTFKMLINLYLQVKGQPNKYTEAVGRLVDIVDKKLTMKYLTSTQQTLTRIFEEFFVSNEFKSYVEGEFLVAPKTEPSEPLHVPAFRHPVTYECHVTEEPTVVFTYVVGSPGGYPYSVREYTIPLPRNMIQSLKRNKGDDRSVLSNLHVFLSFFPELASDIEASEFFFHRATVEGQPPSYPLVDINPLLDVIEEKLRKLE